MSSKKKNAPEKVIEKVVEPKQTATTTSDSKPLTDIFETYKSKIPFIALGVLLLAVIIVFRDYMLGEKAYFFRDIGSDSYNFSYPSMYNTADYIAKHGIPKWSFNAGMGQSIFPFMFRDPFDIIYYLTGKNSILFGIIFKEILKIVLAGMIFFNFLRKLNVSGYASLIGCLLFSFSGFMILGSGWYLFTFEALTLALLLLGFEHLLSGGKWYIFPFGIFLIGISQPFNLYVFGVFLAMYAVLRMVMSDYTIKDGAILLGKMAGLGVVGILVAGPFFLENVVQLLESPRGGGSFSLSHQLSQTPMFEAADKLEMGTSILRFFSTDILGGGMDFKGWHNYLEAPMFYCGIPCLLLMPQVFQFLSKKTKTAFGIFIGIWILAIIFPYFRYSFWLFSGNYYRAFSFFVAVVFIFYSVQALNMILEKRKINLIVLGVTVAFLLVLLNHPYFPESGIVNPTIAGFVSLMIIVHAVLLFLLSKQKNIAPIKYAFLAAVLLEVTYFSGSTVNDRAPITASDIEQRGGYGDYSIEALDYLKKHDNSFYRIDKGYASTLAMHYSLNDGMAQDYKGTSSYNSFNQENYIHYLTLMGMADTMDETSSRWAQGLMRRPMLEAQNGVKYIITKKMVNPAWYQLCDSLTMLNNVIILKNKNVLPLGFGYNCFIRENSFKTLNTFQKDYLSLKAAVVKDADVAKCSGLKEITLADTFGTGQFTFDNITQMVTALKADTMTMSNYTDVLINGKVNLNENRMMYFAMPFDAGWKATVDGKEQDKIILSAGMTGLMLPKGQHTINLAYDLRYLKKGMMMSFAGLLLFAGLFVVARKKGKEEA